MYQEKWKIVVQLLVKKKDNNYGRNVVIQNIKMDLQAMKDKKDYEL